MGHRIFKAISLNALAMLRPRPRPIPVVTALYTLFRNSVTAPSRTTIRVANTHAAHNSNDKIHLIELPMRRDRSCLPLLALMEEVETVESTRKQLVKILRNIKQGRSCLTRSAFVWQERPFLNCLRHAGFLCVQSPIGCERDLAGLMRKWWVVLHLNSMGIWRIFAGSAPWMLNHLGALEDRLAII